MTGSSTPASDLFRATLDQVVEGVDATEHEGLTFEAGALRVFTSPVDTIQRIVTISMAVPPIGMDSHMLFAFAKPATALPHFTLDSVQAPGHGPGQAGLAYHLDLVPRIDMSAEADHIWTVYGPLTEAYTEGKAFEGLQPANISPRQHAIMSPWMLVHRSSEEAFVKVADSVRTYCDHWLGLVRSGVEAPPGWTPTMLAERDAKHRASLFSVEIDPVWSQVDRLVGPELSARFRAILKGDDVLESGGLA